MNDREEMEELAREKFDKTLSRFLCPAQRQQILRDLGDPETQEKVIRFSELIERCPENAEASELDDDALVILKYALPHTNVNFYVMGIERLAEDVASEFAPEVLGVTEVEEGGWCLGELYLGKVLEHGIRLELDFEPVSFSKLKSQIS